jgi:hypothetical protein
MKLHFIIKITGNFPVFYSYDGIFFGFETTTRYFTAAGSVSPRDCSIQITDLSLNNDTPNAVSSVILRHLQNYFNPVSKIVCSVC